MEATGALATVAMKSAARPWASTEKATLRSISRVVEHIQLAGSTNRDPSAHDASMQKPSLRGSNGLGILDTPLTTIRR
jgi:hypothetical protein